MKKQEPVKLANERSEASHKRKKSTKKKIKKQTKKKGAPHDPFGLSNLGRM